MAEEKPSLSNPNWVCIKDGSQGKIIASGMLNGFYIIFDFYGQFFWNRDMSVVMYGPFESKEAALMNLETAGPPSETLNRIASLLADN